LNISVFSVSIFLFPAIVPTVVGNNFKTEGFSDPKGCPDSV